MIGSTQYTEEKLPVVKEDLQGKNFFNRDRDRELKKVKERKRERERDRERETQREKEKNLETKR